MLTSVIYCSHMQPACVVKKESAFDATQALKTFTYVQIALIKLSLFFFFFFFWRGNSGLAVNISC